MPAADGQEAGLKGTEQAYDEKFIHFVVLFNVDEDYFECHEVMEELWLEEGRNRMYQGLLQAAVALYHWRNGNYSGAVKLFTHAENKLSQYPDQAMGLDLRQLRADGARCLAPLHAWVEEGEKSGSQPPEFIPFRLHIVDERLMEEVAAMAQIPLEQRLHGEDTE
ncbi:DUF309 domain-containing protein [Paenibacillus mendelii]|uniref:DUF309 domain-containing protein n=1 Tax=Paenibacillus mendelii TaxID=206163 RepID=A0ABV6JE12_9BACL|nr:DUF309 domain-containing protein [Paenibacillus mendelii]MCQ6563006.1 DUF309 domain-containing protein [Paenibacillus mendelii]